MDSCVKIRSPRLNDCARARPVLSLRRVSRQNCARLAKSWFVLIGSDITISPHVFRSSAGNNSFYSFCGKNCKNPILYFFGPGGKRILHCGRAGQLAAAAAAANCYASIRRSIPRCSAKPGGGRRADAAKEVRFPFFHAASSAAARSADACGFSRIGCSTPWCTRSDSGAGGGRLPDAAQEVVFPVPASRASFNSAGASERSACQPRQRRAKGDAASIRCGIPCCTRSDSGAGGGRLPDAAQEVIIPLGQGRGKSGGHRFYAVG